MLFNTAYIVSYLPKDNLRAKRLEIHDRQIAYWKSKGLDIVVYAQGYEDEDFREGVRYIVNTTNKIDRPGPARNVLLEQFYQTDQDFCLLTDNDIVLYEGEKYCDSDNLVSILQNMPIENLNGVDVFETLNPTQTPFSAFFQENKAILESNLFFRRRPNLSQCFFIRNFRKFRMKEYYFDDWVDEKTGKIIMGEDVAFGIKLTKEGRGVYSLMNAVRKDLGWNVSSWCENKDQRKQAFDDLKNNLLPSLGVGTKNGKLDWAGFGDKYGIPRTILAPKKKVTTILDMME